MPASRTLKKTIFLFSMWSPETPEGLLLVSANRKPTSDSCHPPCRINVEEFSAETHWQLTLYKLIPEGQQDVTVSAVCVYQPGFTLYIQHCISVCIQAAWHTSCLQLYTVTVSVQPCSGPANCHITTCGMKCEEWGLSLVKRGCSSSGSSALYCTGVCVEMLQALLLTTVQMAAVKPVWKSLWRQY